MKSKQLLFALGFVLIFLFTRVPRLQNDTINPDAVNWHYRSQQFINGLKFQQFEKTYQHYHPGVTLMWVTAVPNELFKQATNINNYDIYNFSAFDFIAKFSLVIVQLIISLLIIYYLAKVLGYYKSLFIMTLLSLEPFFLGNSRLYHLDVLLTLLLFLGVILTYLSAKQYFIKYAVFSGIAFSLAFLTKSIGIGGILFFAAINLLMLFKTKDKRHLKTILIGLATFVVVTFVLFPALWVRPVYYLSEIFNEALRVGVRGGHEQIVLGEDTVDAGFNFYPLVLALRLSPFILIGILLFFMNIKNILKKDFSVFIYSGILFYLTYFVLMSFPTKKLDRYMLVLYPFLSLLAVLGFSELKIINTKVKTLLLYILVVLFIGWPLVTLFPYYFTYTSPLFGSAENANKVIALKPFGIGVYDLKTFIYLKYGTDKNLGFIDTKPMKSIYANSKVFDIRVNGASDYDLLILGINEEMPENVLKSKTRFYQDSVMYINGLAYWKVYAKEQ